jgi:hypothetical protein
MTGSTCRLFCKQAVLTFSRATVLLARCIVLLVVTAIDTSHPNLRPSFNTCTPSAALCDYQHRAACTLHNGSVPFLLTASLLWLQTPINKAAEQAPEQALMSPLAQDALQRQTAALVLPDAPDQRQHGANMAGGLLQLMIDSQTAAAAGGTSLAADPAAPAVKIKQDVTSSISADGLQMQALPSCCPATTTATEQPEHMVPQQQQQQQQQQQPASPSPTSHSGGWEVAMDAMLGSMVTDNATPDQGVADELDLAHLFDGPEAAGTGVDDALAWLDVQSGPAAATPAATAGTPAGMVGSSVGDDSMAGLGQQAQQQDVQHRRNKKQPGHHHRRSSSSGCSAALQVKPAALPASTAAMLGQQQQQQQQQQQLSTPFLPPPAVPQALSAPITIPGASQHHLPGSFQVQEALHGRSSCSLQTLAASSMQQATHFGTPASAAGSLQQTFMHQQAAAGGSWQMLHQQQAQQQQMMMAAPVGSVGTTEWMDLRQAKRARQDVPAACQVTSRASSGALSSLACQWQPRLAPAPAPARPITMLGAAADQSPLPAFGGKVQHTAEAPAQAGTSAAPAFSWSTGGLSAGAVTLTVPGPAAGLQHDARGPGHGSLDDMQLMRAFCR